MSASNTQARLSPEVVNVKLSEIMRIEEYASDRAVASPEGPSLEAENLINDYFSSPKYWEMTPESARLALEKRGNPHDHKFPNNIITKDLKIETSNLELPARLYRPMDLEGSNSAAFLFFHGGGFAFGSIEAVDKIAAILAAKANISVISASYRLAPLGKFPDPVFDAKESFEWVIQNANALGLDSNRVAIGGESAGANLAAAVSFLNKDSQQFKPKLQVLIYPMAAGMDVTPSREALAERFLPTINEMDWLMSLYVDPEYWDDPAFNLLRANGLDNLPPTFVVTAGFDPLRDEGAEYAERLKLVGIPVRHTCYHQMIHAFMNFDHMPESHAALNECAQVLDGILNGIEYPNAKKHIRLPSSPLAPKVRLE